MDNIIVDISYNTGKRNFEVVKSKINAKKLSRRGGQVLRKILRELNGNSYSGNNVYDASLIIALILVIVSIVLYLVYRNIIMLAFLSFSLLSITLVIARSFYVSYKFASVTKGILQKYKITKKEILSLNFAVSPFFKMCVVSHKNYSVTIATLSFYTSPEDSGICDDNMCMFMASTRDNLDENVNNVKSRDSNNEDDAVSIDIQSKLKESLKKQKDSPRFVMRSSSIDDIAEFAETIKPSLLVFQDDTRVRYGGQEPQPRILYDF
jgi:hypothetical protein